LDQTPKLPHRNSNDRFTSISGHNVGEFYLPLPTGPGSYVATTLAPAKGLGCSLDIVAWLTT
jgi:hypothetical protein